MLGWLRVFRILISLIAVMGNYQEVLKEIFITYSIFFMIHLDALQCKEFSRLNGLRFEHLSKTRLVYGLVRFTQMYPGQ
jgi:hypothetical protein